MNADSDAGAKEQEAINQAYAKAIWQFVMEPWPQWVVNLLTRIAKSYFPTLDWKNIVRKFEQAIHQKDFLLLEFSLAEKARFCGHCAALLDFMRLVIIPNAQGKEKKLYEGAADFDLPSFNLANGNREIGSIRASEYLRSENLSKNFSFAEKAEFMAEYAIAYQKTITPTGQPAGITDASNIHLQLLIHSLFWPVVGRPKSIAEMHRRMLSFAPVKKLSPLEEKRKADRDAALEKRLQQICERLGLRLRGQRIRNSPKKRLLPAQTKA